MPVVLAAMVKSGEKVFCSYSQSAVDARGDRVCPFCVKRNSKKNYTILHTVAYLQL